MNFNNVILNSLGFFFNSIIFIFIKIILIISLSFFLDHTFLKFLPIILH